MTADPNEPIKPADAPPMPRIKKMRWPFPLIWLVPVAAACLAGYYIYQHNQETGVEFTISFDDASGLKPGQTTVSLHGVTIGHVKTVELSPDHQHTIATVQLMSRVDFLAHNDTLFWVVRPEVSLQNISGLNTLVSGAYIDCRPGTGPVSHSFDGLGGPPAAAGAGLNIIVSADQIGAMSVDSPIDYRGVQVGVVKDIRLSSSAESVNITLLIWDRYRVLVRTNSVFWAIKGADISGSLFGGLKLKIGSVQNILSGGVSFNTPEKNYGVPAVEGSSFVLHDHPEDDWLKWRAKIKLPDDQSSAGDNNANSGLQLPMVKKE